ncbi:MAG TPA: ribonuclease III [Acidimicrobiales bacterium]|nr:ribonuclease III [Acidimicrobiales bacterium]
MSTAADSGIPVPESAAPGGGRSVAVEGPPDGRLPGEEPVEVGVLGERLGYEFRSPILLQQAMAHRSWVAEDESRNSNERLEYLGDAVLGLVVAEHTYRSHPDLSDGTLSKVRAAVVNTRVLGELALDLGLPEHLRLGRGEDQSGGRAKESILADATEAVIGAVYLDGGLEPARRLVLSLLADRISAAVGEPGESDHKSRLQERSVRLGRGVPVYEVEGFGPDHARRYRASVSVAGRLLGTGEGRSKKEAEQVAAHRAGEALEGEGGGGGA